MKIVCTATFAILFLASCTDSSAPADAPSKVATLKAISPVTMTGQVGTAAPSAPSVIAQDGNGRPVAGVVVTFASTTSVLPNQRTLTSGSDGIVTLSEWMLSTKAGDNDLTASIAGEEWVRFRATGLAGPAAVVSKYLGDSQFGAPGVAVALPPTVLVSDRYDNPVPGTTVSFLVETGAGQVSRPEATTDAVGLASAGNWILGVSGGQRLNVKVQNLAPIQFSAVAIPIIPGACSATVELKANVVLKSELNGSSCTDGLDRRFQFVPVTPDLHGVPLEFHLTSTEFDTQLTLVDSLGETIASNYNSSAGARNSGFVAIPPPKGSRFVVTSAHAEGAGQYQLSYTNPRKDFTGCPSLFVYRGYEAEQYLGQFACRGSYFDEFLVISSGGRSLAVEVEDLEYAVWDAQIVTPTGEEVPLAYIPNTYKYRLTLITPVSGTYKIQVSSPDGRNYKLSVR